MDLDTISIDSSSEREEGEIISDELEDISDDSINVSPSPKTGKLKSHKESLRALSLSSIKDVRTVEYTPAVHYEKRKTRKKRRISRHPYRRKSESNSSSDSDRDVSLTKKLLKDAIRIDSTKAHNNSLRTRLRGMVKSPTCENIQTDDKTMYTDDLQDIPMSISDSELPEIDNSPVQLESASEKEAVASPMAIEQDDELIQLRLEALKTAVMNKLAHRKKKNVVQDEKPNNQETNKENSSDNLNNANNSPTIAVNCTEHSDSNAQNSANNSDEDEDILRAILLASISKKITNKDSSIPIKNNNGSKSASLSMKNCKTDKPPTNLNIPKIPRFILSVNNSDSDEDSFEEETEKDRQLKNVQNSDVQKEVESEVEKFLKQQRAEVEAKQKPISKEQKTVIKPAEKVKISLNNDLYKILPKSKQLEYENLMQKLKSAEKKPRLRKLSNRTLDHKTAKLKIPKNGDNKTVAGKNNEIFLQQTIRQMQIDGRLQIKGKYHVLTPLLKKLSEASQEQKKQQLRINQLLEQLKEARNQCQKSQNDYNEAKKEFFRQKEEIDRRKIENILPKPTVCPTTQIKVDLNKLASKPAPVSQKKPILNKPKEILRCKVVLEKCPVNLTDPSDIEFKKIEPEEIVTVPKYTSPLDNNGSRNKKINPLEIFCPYEINGSCRDKECSYNHCNKDL